MHALELPPPLVGVLVGRRTIDGLAKQKISSQISYLTKANEEARVNLYFFDTSSIDFKTLSVMGMYWDAQKRFWQQKKFALPDTLYIKGGGAPKTIEKLVRLVRQKGTVINHPRFDKWKVYCCLVQQPKVRDHLPETIVDVNPQHLRTMLGEHGIVYLKPRRGRKGRKVLRVHQLKSTYLLSSYNDLKGPQAGLHKRKVRDFSSLVQELDIFYNSKSFLVQRAIDLITVGDKLVDLRAEMQRNKDGAVEILGVTARVGGSQSPITTHASAMSLDNFLRDICEGQDWTPGLKERINQFLFSVYEGIEDCYGRYGEIGIDFGLDKKGEIWFIECNSQSTKVSLEKVYGPRVIYKSFLGILEYAKYVYSKQHLPPPEESGASPALAPEPDSPIVAQTAPSDVKDETCSDPPKQSVIVGVLVRRGIIRRNQEQVFRLQRLAEANSTAKTILYAFSLEDVNFETITIEGTYFDEKTGKWQKKSFPFPDVIYNRKANSQGVRSDKFRRLVKELAVKKINPVNDFDKWDLYLRLSKISSVQQYLPYTVQFRSVKELRQLLSKFGCLYLKANVGRNGTTVMRLRKTDKGYITSHVDNQVRTMMTNNWDDVVTLVKSFYGRKQFLIQQGIPVYSINGQNVDMRAELQRNGQGKLEVIYIGARIGVKNSPVTSTRTDSDVLSFPDLLRDKMGLSGTEYNSLMNKVNRFLVTVYEGVESVYGEFGEMGIDFALDLDQGLWLIECNAKSAKMALMLSAEKETIDQVFLNPLEYAKYIAGC